MGSLDERTETWDRSFTLGKGGSLKLDQGAGAIEIIGWDQDVARVVATKRVAGGSGPQAARHLDRATIRAVLRGQRLEVEASPPSGFLGLSVGHATIDFRIAVPLGTRISVESGSGNVTVDGVDGEVEIDVGSGDVRVKGLGAGVRVDTGSGRVRAEDVRGRVYVDSGSGEVTVLRADGPVIIDAASGPVEVADVIGDVKVDNGSGAVGLTRVRGNVEVDTGNGDVALLGIWSRRIHVDTGDGAVTCDFVPQADGTYDVDTGGGRVELRVPASSSAEFDLESGAGRIDCSLPLLSREADTGRLRGILHRSSSRIAVDSGHGDIVVRASELAVDTPPAVNPPETDRPAAVKLVEAKTAPNPAGAIEIGPIETGGAEPSRALKVTDEDYVRVLKMVEEKKITPEAAEELLKALEEEGEPEDHSGFDD